MAQKWGFGDYACHLWAAGGMLSPAEWKHHFNGTIAAPMEVVVIYRELVAQGRAEVDLANDIVAMTPEAERPRISDFFLGSESLSTDGKKRGANSVRETIGKVMARYKLPVPVSADEQRVDGWRYLYSCLRQASLINSDNIPLSRIQEGPMLLVSSDCASVIENLPLAVRYEKDPNDVEPRSAEWASVCDAARYLLKSKPSPVSQPPREVRLRMLLESYQDATERHMAYLRFQEGESKISRAIRAPNWRTGS